MANSSDFTRARARSAGRDLGASLFGGGRKTLTTSPARLRVGAPIVGNLMAMARDRLWLMERASAVRGGICEIAMGAGRIVVVSEPDLVHEVLVAKADSFVKGTSFRFLRPILGHGL